MSFTKECNERHRILRTWVMGALGAIITIGLAVAGVLYAKANGNTKENQENTVAVARVEEKVEEGFKRVDQHLTRQGEDIKELLREAKK